MFFPLRVSLLSLLRQWLPGLLTPQQRSGNLSHGLTVGRKCHGRHLICVCVFYFKPVSSSAPSNLTGWIQKGSAGWSQRDALWQLLASLQLERPCKQHKHVLQASVLMQTRPPASPGSPVRYSQTHTHTHHGLQLCSVSFFNGYR